MVATALFFLVWGNMRNECVASWVGVVYGTTQQDELYSPESAGFLLLYLYRFWMEGASRLSRKLIFLPSSPSTFAVGPSIPRASPDRHQTGGIDGFVPVPTPAPLGPISHSICILYPLLSHCGWNRFQGGDVWDMSCYERDTNVCNVHAFRDLAHVPRYFLFKW